MNDQYISTEELNKKLDEAYNLALADVEGLIKRRKSIYSSGELTYKEEKAFQLLFDNVIDQIESLKKHS